MNKEAIKKKIKPFFSFTIIFIITFLLVTFIATIFSYYNYSKNISNFSEKKDELFKINGNKETIKIFYNYPLDNSALQNLAMPDEYKKNYNKISHFDAIKFSKNDNLVSDVHCIVHKRPFLFFHILFSKLLRENSDEQKSVEYICSIKQKFPDGSPALEAVYTGFTSTTDINRIAKSKIDKDYSSINALIHGDILESFTDSDKKFIFSSYSYYKDNLCNTQNPGYQHSENKCLQDMYMIMSKSEILQSFYPNGILENEQKFSKNSWISRSYDKEGRLVRKVVTKNQYREETYYVGNRLKIINKIKNFGHLDKQKTIQERYSFDGELEYKIIQKGNNVKVAYEYKDGKKRELTKAQVYNLFKLEYED